LYRLSPSIHKFGYEFTCSGLSTIRQAHRPEFIEGLSEHSKALIWIIYVTVICESKHLAKHFPEIADPLRSDIFSSYERLPVSVFKTILLE
jgi:hypothetical protein